jgi:eukaryotic-like serine/threonine-protein kinase
MAVGAADRVIANRYALKSALGRSELGTVWCAKDTLLGRDVVVREMVLPAWLPDAERRATQASVLAEAGAVARLSHPGLVTVFDVIANEAAIFIVTELVQAPSLADLVLAEGPLSPRRVAEIGAELASVLESAHSAGIVHRDVKPANVMVRPDGRVLLGGFGVTPLQGVPRLAATAMALGSPSYVAPEQARGVRGGPAADVWGLGATMFFALEGAPPFDKGTLVQTLAAVVDEDPRPPLRAGPLAALLMALLAKNPQDRLSASRARIWLRWLAETTRSAPSSAGSSLEAPASDPAKGPAPEPSSRSPAQPRTRPILPPAPRVRRQRRGWTAVVVALLLLGGVLAAWLTGDFPSGVSGTRAAPATTIADRGVIPGQERAAPASARGRLAGTGTTRPAPATTRKPAATQAPSAPTTTAQGQLPLGWRAFTNRAGNNRVGIPPGFRVHTRVRYHAAVIEEQGGARRLFTVRSQTPSAELPQASRDYRAWARTHQSGFREVAYRENQTYAGLPGAVVFEYQATIDGRRVQVRHVNVKGRTWGYNIELIVPVADWDASQTLARQFEQAFTPLG